MLRDCIKTLSSLSIQDAFNLDLNGQNLIFFTSIQQVSKFPLHVVTYIHEWRTWKMKNVLNSDPARIQTKLWPVRTIGNLSSRITDIKDKKKHKTVNAFQFRPKQNLSTQINKFISIIYIHYRFIKFDNIPAMNKLFS